MIYRLRERFLGLLSGTVGLDSWRRRSSHRCGFAWLGVAQFLPVAVICERVVAGESQEHPEPRPQREEDLSCSIHPHLDESERERRTEIDIKRSRTISFTTSGMLLPAVVHFKANKHSIPNTDSIRVVPFYSSKIFVFSCSRSDSSVFDFFFFRAGSCCVSRTETRPADSCTQGDLKRSFHSALKRRGQRWISVSETGRGGLC